MYDLRLAADGVFSAEAGVPPQTKHYAPGTKHQVPSTKYQAPSTKYQAPSTKHQAPKIKIDSKLSHTKWEHHS
jgi:hypothetical protein